VLFTLAGCAGNNGPADTQADADAISASTVAWIAAYNAGDADKIVAMYADDAILMPPDAPAASTHDAMKQYLANDITAAKAAGVTLALDGETSGVSGDLGWHSGTFHAAGANGATVATGKYAEIWRKAGGKWLMIRDIWNTDAPPAAAAPAAAVAPMAAPAARKR
jgi:ketosteroid isomerase-like protein